MTTQRKKPRPEPLVDIPEIAFRLGVHNNTIRTLAARGDIPCYMVGTQYRFDVAEVLEAVRRRNTPFTDADAEPELEPDPAGVAGE
jgi:excisionase family DNA binding protein